AAAAACAQAGIASMAETPSAPSPRPIFVESFMFPPKSLERDVVGLAGADAHRLTDLQHKDLAVTDRTGVGGLLDRLDDPARQGVGRGDLDLDLRHHVRAVFGPTVDFRLALLPSESFDFGNGHPLHAQRGKGFAH